MTRPSFLAVLAAACFVTLPAAAQFQKPEQAIKYRQSAFTVMNVHFGRLAAMAQGKVPFDAKQAAEDAALVASLSALPFTAFGPGTDKGAPVRALPEVWTDPKFKQGAERMQQEIAALAAAAKGGNLDAIKAAVGETGKACKACHDDFRSDKYVTN